MALQLAHFLLLTLLLLNSSSLKPQKKKTHTHTHTPYSQAKTVSTLFTLQKWPQSP